MSDEQCVQVDSHERAGSLVKPHVRRMPLSTVQFTCQRCRQAVFITQYPGPAPKYCLKCKPIVAREQSAERVRRKRARDKSGRSQDKEMGMSEKACDRDIVAVQPNNINNKEAVARKGKAQIVGVLAGYQVSLDGDTLQMPNTLAGRALATLLTGKSLAGNSQDDTLLLDVECLQGIAELIALLAAFEQAIAKKPAEPTSLSIVEQELLNFGIRRKEAVRLAADPWVTIERVNAWTVYINRKRGQMTSPAGLLVSSLLEHIEAPSGSRSQLQTEACVVADHPHNRLATPLPPELTEAIDDAGSSPASIWQTACEELKHQMPRETFDAHLRQARLLGYCRGTMTVAARNVSSREWLEHRLNKVIERTVSQIAGQPIQMLFVAQEAGGR